METSHSLDSYYYRTIHGICVSDSGYAQTNVIYTPNPNSVTNSQKRYNLYLI